MKENKAQDKRERMLATMACKTAIKAGQPLPREKMEFLLQELFRVSNPSLCPHGRPIIVKISRAQIEKGLKR
jgi:DNA mismatch repair protein MutL